MIHDDHVGFSRCFDLQQSRSKIVGPSRLALRSWASPQGPQVSTGRASGDNARWLQDPREHADSAARPRHQHGYGLLRWAKHDYVWMLVHHPKTGPDFVFYCFFFLLESSVFSKTAASQSSHFKCSCAKFLTGTLIGQFTYFFSYLDFIGTVPPRKTSFFLVGG